MAFLTNANGADGMRTMSWLLMSAVTFASACSTTHETTTTPGPTEPAAPAAPAETPLPEVFGLPTLEDTNPDPNIVEVSLNAEATTIEIDGKPVKMRGYNGLNPGPMLKAKVGDEVIVHFRNDLSEPTTIHWHGLRISDAMDGSPRLQSPVKPGEEFTYRFKVPDAGSFWYHPHVKANEQIEAGLYGPIVVFDPKVDPVYDAERYVMVDDILLENGKRPPPYSDGMPELMHGRIGNVMLTNGRAAKEAHAEATQGSVERWRIVNTANARTMELELEGASFRIIGTDGGLLAAPYRTKRIVVPVGRRFDLEVTYDKPGKVSLVNYVPTLDENDEVIEVKEPSFVVDVAASDKAPREIAWPEITELDRAPTQNETITIDVVEGGEQGVEWRLNGVAHGNDPLFTFDEGATVKFKLENKVGPEHPFHLHGQFFRIVGKGAEPGLKDVVLIPGMSTVEVVAYLDNPGRWMAHCHNLEHAELGMMSEIVVKPKNGVLTPPTGDGHQH